LLTNNYTYLVFAALHGSNSVINKL